MPGSKNPDTDFIARDQGQLVGFINMLPVKHKTIMKFMRGDIRGWEILLFDLNLFDFSSAYLGSCPLRGLTARLYEAS